VQVNDVRRDTLISTLLDDVRAFLKQQLGHSLAPATASSLQLAIFDGDTCMPLSPDMTAENADLFNAAAQSYHKDGCTLVKGYPPRGRDRRERRDRGGSDKGESDESGTAARWHEG
jgi:hypothetical protein